MTETKNNILVSGASFAGLSTAYWMSRLGYDVTVVEIAEGLKRGGTPVNIEGDTVEVVKRMGLFERIHANRLPMEFFELKNSSNVTETRESTQENPERLANGDCEIERDILLDLLFEAVEGKVEFIFCDTVTSLREENDRVEVTFKKGQVRSFDLVFGCDGIHSAIRRLHFGDESQFSRFLGAYFSITIVDRLLIRENTTQLYNEPGRGVMLNAYNGKTDVVLCFRSEEIPYDYRDEEQQRKIIQEGFCGAGWRTAELLEEVNRSGTFYFDKLCQIKVPSWAKGRVALVGDSCYCASPAAGKGGSLAIDGAAALATAFQKWGGDYERVFREYEASFRPFIEETQAFVVDFGLEALLPRTEEEIRRRNSQESPFRSLGAK